MIYVQESREVWYTGDETQKYQDEDQHDRRIGEINATFGNSISLYDNDLSEVHNDNESNDDGSESEVNIMFGDFRGINDIVRNEQSDQSNNPVEAEVFPTATGNGANGATPDEDYGVVGMLSTIDDGIIPANDREAVEIFATYDAGSDRSTTDSDGATYDFLSIEKYSNDCVTSRGTKRPKVSEPTMEDGEECVYFVDSEGKILSEHAALKVSECITKAQGKNKQVSQVFMKAMNTTVRRRGIYARN